MARTAPTRAVTATAAAALMTLLLASTVAAGGWASATLDQQPTDPGPGGTIEVGFTLLQHGVTPVDWGQPIVMLVNRETGQRVAADARQEGATGHWVAELTVPASGTWVLDMRHDLEIVPANFQPIAVGAGAAAPHAATAATFQPALIGVGVLLGLLAIAGMAIVTVARRRSRAEGAGI